MLSLLSSLTLQTFVRFAEEGWNQPSSQPSTHYCTHNRMTVTIHNIHIYQRHVKDTCTYIVPVEWPALVVGFLLLDWVLCSLFSLCLSGSLSFKGPLKKAHWHTINLLKIQVYTCGMTCSSSRLPFTGLVSLFRLFVLIITSWIYRYTSALICITRSTWIRRSIQQLNESCVNLCWMKVLDNDIHYVFQVLVVNIHA